MLLIWRWVCFYLFVSEKTEENQPNDLTTNKLSVFLSVADFANRAKFGVFMASVSCLRVCNCNKIMKTTQQSVTVA